MPDRRRMGGEAGVIGRIPKDSPPPTKATRPVARRRRPTDETPITNAKSLFGPGFPVQLTKVQRPPLRVETLSRPRLVDWLAARMEQRLVFITAEPGYGKTTLMADFARRTRLRVLWYRLDEQDRDWIAVLNYLVASGREIDPEFAPATAALLSDVGTGTASRERVVETFIRELQALDRTSTVLFVDDWHLVDGIDDVRELMREIVIHAPERMTFVFSSRRRPTLSVARFRALGEVAELTTADLRFSEDEIERLFRDTYGRPLDADVVNELSGRTEGWAASLQLVQTALRDRTPASIRTFVRELSGIDSNLYDYLAEEVVGDLDDQSQQFLMRTSILRTVDPDLTTVVTGVDRARARQLIEAAEKMGLLSRRGEATRHSQRYHTLVREFLQDRLVRAIGEDAVRDLHRAVGRHADGSNWRLAAHHYEAAGDIDDVHRVIDSSALEIMSAGDYVAVTEWLDRYPPTIDRSIHHIARSRVSYNADRSEDAVRDAETAASLAESEGGLASELAQLNLIGSLVNQGAATRAVRLARRLRLLAQDSTVRDILDAYLSMASVNEGAPIGPTLDYMARLAIRQESAGRTFFAAISLTNLAVMARSSGDAARTRSAGLKAIELLGTDPLTVEAAAAASAIGWAEAHLGNVQTSSNWFRLAQSVRHVATRLESVAELADAHLWYGDIADAESVLGQLDDHVVDSFDYLRPTRIEILIRKGAIEDATALLAEELSSQRWWPPGWTARSLYLKALLAGADDRAFDGTVVRSVVDALSEQGMLLWQRPCLLIAASDQDSASTEATVSRIAREDPTALSMAAEAVVPLLPRLSSTTARDVAHEIHRRPERWRSALRVSLSSEDTSIQAFAARFLDEVGTPEDVQRLRAMARRFRSGQAENSLGKSLARRLAQRVYVEDLGRVRIRVADREVPGSRLRRKVLALLVFLLSRDGFSATRDQVLDALWPDLTPEVAANSLHQTIYFLRRVFEPGYKEDLSADYLHHDSDVVWLDRELVASRSATCAGLIARLRTDFDPVVVSELSGTYTAPFALDFAYEDWAAGYRASLHADYIELVERGAQIGADNGHVDRGVDLLARALEVDPDADHLELMLLRLYRRTGAFAAANERYEHYSALLREQLGVEPPALDSL